mmetsp:Transcript_37200/g.79354  ORF Transcript_37200/g.79354 Transcript_37200/m.79354 type:complete len:102 (+) Transcript_37200:488-793(+)
MEASASAWEEDQRIAGSNDDQKARRRTRRWLDPDEIIATSKGTRCRGRAEGQRCLSGKRELSRQRKDVDARVDGAAMSGRLSRHQLTELVCQEGYGGGCVL